MPEYRQTLTTPDFDVYPTAHRVIRAELDPLGVKVVWDDGAKSRYHTIWLRENSPDPGTMHPVTRETTLRVLEMPANLEITSAGVTDRGDLVIGWSEGLAESRYHRGWLRNNSAGIEDANRYTVPDLVFWDASIQDNLPRFDGSKFPNDDETFALWLEAIHIYGFAILTNLPEVPQSVDTVAGMIGTVRSSNFGEFFDVLTKPDADSNAYTTLALPAHTDLATREYMPGLQMLLCINNSANGGESLLTDGFSVARYLQGSDCELYDVLTSTEVEFKNIAIDTDYRWQTPLFVLDRQNTIAEVRWTDWLRAPLCEEPETVDKFYAALRAADLLMNSPDFQIEHKLAPGELLCFDNRRVLHGRNAFDPNSGERWLRGCYVEREELHSRLRILDRKRRG